MIWSSIGRVPTSGKLMLFDGVLRLLGELRSLRVNSHLGSIGLIKANFAC